MKNHTAGPKYAVRLGGTEKDRRLWQVEYKTGKNITHKIKARKIRLVMHDADHVSA